MFDYDYTVSTDNSAAMFKKVCDRIESFFPNAKKQDLLIDVDGTTIQEFNLGSKAIAIYDDYDVGAVYVKSDIDLSQIMLKS